MKKKQYIQPSASVYQVSTCEVICGSGNQYENMRSDGSGGPSGNSGFFGGDASQRRNGWDDYENM